MGPYSISIATIIISIFEGNSGEVGKDLSVPVNKSRTYVSSSRTTKFQHWLCKDFLKSFISFSKQVTDEMFNALTLISASLDIPCSGFLHVKHCSSLPSQLKTSAT